MSRRLVTKCTMAVIIVWAVHGRADDEPARAPELKGAITGLVVDPQGRPVAGAAVWGLAHQESLDRRTADATGGSGWPRSRPTSAGHRLGRCTRARASAATTSASSQARTTTSAGSRSCPARGCVGRVVDCAGQDGRRRRTSSSRSTVISSATRSLRRGPSGRSNAGGDGRFATRPLPAGDAHFCFSAPGKVRTFVEKKAEPGTPVVDLGDVTLPDESRSPASSSTRRASRHPESRSSPITTGGTPQRPTRSGRFTVHGVGKDLKILRLQSNDYFSPKPFEVAPGRTDLKLTVIKAYEIHGTAVDAETGRPVPIDTVRLCMVLRDPDDGHVTLVG